MKFLIQGLAAIGLIAGSPLQGAADDSKLKPAGLFADHMVLQQTSSAPIWGTAAPGSEVLVTASWGTAVGRAKADADGKWFTRIQTPKAGGPFKILIECGSDRLELKDVMSGEVWLCTGQSNMQWKMRGFGVDHFKEDVVKAKFPGIRFCDVPQVMALEEQDEVKAKWSVCSPATVLNFSATGYFFGSKLHESLGVPIGLISTTWGGSSAEAWVSRDTLMKEFPEFGDVIGNYAELAEEAGVVHLRGPKAPKGLNQRSPAVLYNSMIKPLQPYAIRGAIWYQGESNVTEPEQYRKLFPAVIRDWRRTWGIGDFPFYYVQIAPFKYNGNPYDVAFLREAQFMAQELPQTGMVVTMDIGDVDNIHPKQKKPVGERLAALALARTYGKAGIVDSGPCYKGFRVEGNKLRIAFDSIGGGLASRDGQPLSHFTIAPEAGDFVAANARIDGNTVLVWSDEVAAPAAVRFAWGNADMPNLMNKEGLPVSSFRTDTRPMKRLPVVKPAPSPKRQPAVNGAPGAP